MAKNLLLYCFLYFFSTLTVFGQLTLTHTVTNATCSANGAITTTVTGGTPPYTFYRNFTPFATQNSNTFTFSLLQPNSYQIKVVDSSTPALASPLQTVVVGGTYVEPTLTCVTSGCDIAAIVNGGKAPFEYAISTASPTGPFSPFQSANTFPIPLAQTCYIQVKDSCGNIYTKSTVINQGPLYFQVACVQDSLVDSTFFTLDVVVEMGGFPPYSFECTSTNGAFSESNLTGIFDSLTLCEYTVTMEDACGNQIAHTSTACAHIEAKTYCIDCENGALTLNAGGGKPPYTYYITNDLQPSSPYTSTTGTFTGLPAPTNGEYYQYWVKDACGTTSPWKKFYCMKAITNCVSNPFDGQVSFDFEANYLESGAYFPMTVIANNYTTDTVIVNDSSDVPFILDGFLSGAQSFEVIDSCGQSLFFNSQCSLERDISMIFTGGTPGTCSGGGGPLQGSICGNTLSIVTPLAGCTYQVNEVPSGNLYGINTTGLFPLIPSGVYAITIISPTGFPLSTDTFDTNIYFEATWVDCRNLYVASCPSGLLFDLEDMNGNVLVAANVSGYFPNLTPGECYKVRTYNPSSLLQASEMVCIEDVGALSYVVQDCKDLIAQIHYSPNTNVLAPPVYTLTSQSTGGSIQNLSGLFPNLNYDTYQLTVTRGDCDTAYQTIQIGAPLNASFCVELEYMQPTFPYTWRLETISSEDTLYLFSPSSVPVDTAMFITNATASTNIFHHVPVNTFVVRNKDCDAQNITLPTLPPDSIYATITSVCLNLACIHVSGGWGYLEWNSLFNPLGFAYCGGPDEYYLYENGVLIDHNVTGDFCNLFVGGTYTIKLRKGGINPLVTATTSVFISPYTPPNLMAYNGAVCPASPVADIYLFTQGTGAPFTFNLLNPPAGYPITTITANSPYATFPGLPAGNYQFMLYDNCGASSDFAAFVGSIEFEPQWQKTCEGATTFEAPLFLNATYLWTDSLGNVLSTNNTGSVNTLLAGTYTVQVQTGACSFTTTFTTPSTYSLTGFANASSTPVSAPFTSGWGTVNLIGNSFGLDTTTTWQVISGNAANATILNPTQAQTTLNVTQSGYYTLVYQVGVGECSDSDTVTIYFEPCELFKINLSSTIEICKGVSKDGSATVVASGGSGQYSYSWNTGETTTTISNLHSGTYTVTARNLNGCSLSEANTLIQSVYVDYSGTVPNPQFYSYPSNAVIIGAGSVLLFNNTSTNATSYSWDFGGLATSTEINPKFQFEAAGNYLVNLTAFNNDCPSNYQLNYQVVSVAPIAAPNAFSPNGDGVNDSFMPVLGEEVVAFTLTVWDRWGKELFTTQTTSLPWDGNYKGKSCPEGVYTYLIVATNRIGKQAEMRGTVNLFR